MNIPSGIFIITFATFYLKFKTMLKRVVVTGLGALTPLGNQIKDFWQNVVAGKSAAARITHFDPTLFRTQFA